MRKAFFAIAIIFMSASAASAQSDKNATRSNPQANSVSSQPAGNGANQTSPNGTTSSSYGATGNKNDHTGQK